MDIHFLLGILAKVLQRQFVLAMDGLRPCFLSLFLEVAKFLILLVLFLFSLGESFLLHYNKMNSTVKQCLETFIEDTRKPD